MKDFNEIRNRGRVKGLVRRFSLTRDQDNQKLQAFHDCRKLRRMVWPYFYVNYFVSPYFPKWIEDLGGIANKDDFVDTLVDLFELYYVAGLLSQGCLEFKRDVFYRGHFYDMQYGRSVLLSVKGDTPLAIVENALCEMLYYDMLYSWSFTTPFGVYCHSGNSKSLLYDVERSLSLKKK